LDWDNPGKPGLIPDTSWRTSVFFEKAPQGALEDGPAAHQLVGEVMAHQGEDG
jgi:hypothetical protein